MIQTMLLGALLGMAFAIISGEVFANESPGVLAGDAHPVSEYVIPLPKGYRTPMVLNYRYVVENNCIPSYLSTTFSLPNMKISRVPEVKISDGKIFDLWRETRGQVVLAVPRNPEGAFHAPLTKNGIIQAHLVTTIRNIKSSRIRTIYICSGKVK